MTETRCDVATVPLDLTVWRAWLLKNQAKEQALNAKILKRGGVVLAILLGVILRFVTRP
jgi:hypothetical protein